MSVLELASHSRAGAFIFISRCISFVHPLFFLLYLFFYVGPDRLRLTTEVVITKLRE